MFIVKQYNKEEGPIIKGHGFDGLRIGEDRQEAQEFIDFVNKLIESTPMEINSRRLKDKEIAKAIEVWRKSVNSEREE